MPDVANTNDSAERSAHRIVWDGSGGPGGPYIRDTRVRVTSVLATLADELSLGAVLDEYPQLTREDVEACLNYAWAVIDHWRFLPSGAPRHLSTVMQRAAAAGLVSRAAVVVDDSMLVAEMLDLTSASIMTMAGIDDEPARAILAALWTSDPVQVS